MYDEYDIDPIWKKKLQEDIVVTQQVIPLGDYPVTPEVREEGRRRSRKMVQKYRDILVKQEAGKEPDMNEYDDVQASRKYLKDQVQKTEKNAAASLEKKFGLVDDTPPSESKELVDRILAGSYKIPTLAYIQANPYKYLPYGLIWRTVDEDRPGFDAAAAKLKEFVQPAWDAANVLPVDQAMVQLEILRDNVKSLVGDEPKKSKK